MLVTVQALRDVLAARTATNVPGVGTDGVVTVVEDAGAVPPKFVIWFPLASTIATAPGKIEPVDSPLNPRSVPATLMPV